MENQAEVNFYFNGNDTIIQCNPNESMQNIVNKFLSKNGLKENQNLCYLYNGENIGTDKLTFVQQAKKIDKQRNKMNIIVTSDDTNYDEELEKSKLISKDIICPECKENILIDIKDFKINMHGCKNNHDINNISLYKFENTQKIDLRKILCEQCNKKNKYESYQKQFFVCYTCNKNLCLLCKEGHDKSHIIINDDNKKYICKMHNEIFSKYCNNCKKDICILCEEEHQYHDCLDLGKKMPNKNELLMLDEKLKTSVENFKIRINLLIDILNNMVNLLHKYYQISNSLINNFVPSKRNFIFLQNMNYLKEINVKLIEKLDIIMKDITFYDLYQYSFDNFYDENGEKYSGEIKNGLKEGKGILYYNKDSKIKEDRYEGDFHNDKREGKGILFWKNGDKYEGDWKDDKREGKGKVTFINGEIYEGDWKNNIYEGKGIFYYKNGDKYEGDWKNGIKNGRGIINYVNGEMYEGDWNNDIKEGKGVYCYKNGEIYDGDWKNNKFNGKGIFHYQHGEKYDGQWIDNIYNGKGIYYYKNGDKYEGDWKNGKKEGKGIIFYKNGDKYEGDWKNNIRLGKCILTYSNKDQYEGDWKNEEKNGYGKYYYNDGSSYEGNWKDGKRDGKGVMLWKNGDRYEGDWKYDKRQGNGKMYYAQAGEYYDGEWYNNKRDGKGTLTLRNGKKKTGPWKDDEFKGIDILRSFSKIFK